MINYNKKYFKLKYKKKITQAPVAASVVTVANSELQGLHSCFFVTYCVCVGSDVPLAKSPIGHKEFVHLNYEIYIHNHNELYNELCFSRPLVINCIKKNVLQ